MNAESVYVADHRPAALILLRHLAIVAAFNLAGALIATYAMDSDRSFLENLVFSMCVGTLALLFIDGGRLWIWGRGIPRRAPFIVLVIASMPAAKLLGDRLALWMLGLDHVAAYQSRNATGMIIITMLFCAFISWLFWSNGKMAVLRAAAEAERARAAATEKQALQAQLQMLQAQIEPHMLFNTLANLQGLIAVDAVRARHMLDQLIQYLRATLSAARAGQTSLEQEFTLLDAYLGLMAVRLGARLSYALHLPEELRATMVPPLLLQPLVENALKHGIEPRIGGGRIEVKAAHDAGTLLLDVADTGLGLDHPGIQAGTQLGIANIRERLRALYGEKARISLTPNTPEGALAQIRIPL